MKACITCQEAIGNVKFCGHCGESQMCKNCNHPFEQSEKFCRKCGTATGLIESVSLGLEEPDKLESFKWEDTAARVISFSKKTGQKIAEKTRELQQEHIEFEERVAPIREQAEEEHAKKEQQDQEARRQKDYERQQADRAASTEAAAAHSSIAPIQAPNQPTGNPTQTSTSPSYATSSGWSVGALVTGAILVVVGIIAALYATAAMDTAEYQIRDAFGEAMGDTSATDTIKFMMVGGYIAAGIGVIVMLTARRKTVVPIIQANTAGAAPQEIVQTETATQEQIQPAPTLEISSPIDEAAMTDTDYVAQLEKLAGLLEKGHISQEEFEVAKGKLL